MTSSFAPSSSRRLASLDAFRGACGLAVFLTHWFLWANFLPKTDAQWMLRDGLKTAYEVFNIITANSGGQHPAVLGFFVLSGFCIHARCAASAEYPHGWRRYLLSRARRILPVYCWGALLGLVFVFLQRNWPTPNPLLSPHAAGDWRDLSLRILALPALVPRDVILGNWTLNTVSTEIVIYLLYPLLLTSARRLNWMAPLAAWIALQFFALMIAPYFSQEWLVNTPLIMGAYWYIGMLAAEWHYRRAKALPWWIPLLTWGLFLALREAPDSALRYVAINLARSLAFASVLLWLIDYERSHSFFGASALVRFLCLAGRTSYSLYAVHTPVIFATTWALGVGKHSYYAQLLFTLVACLVVTAATYWLVERPFLGSRLRSP